jgi:hypothetical protein
MNDTPTPETDAVATPYIGFYSCATVPANLARKLERERDEAREKFELMYQTKGDDIYEARKQRDRLAEALRKLANEDYRGNAPHSVFIARTALATLNQPKP